MFAGKEKHMGLIFHKKLNIMYGIYEISKPRSDERTGERTGGEAKSNMPLEEVEDTMSNEFSKRDMHVHKLPLGRTILFIILCG